MLEGDPIALLNAIEEHAMPYTENKYEAAIVDDALMNSVLCKQKDDEDLVDLTRRIKSSRSVLESQVGTKLQLKKIAEGDPAWIEADATNPAGCYDRAYTTSTLYLNFSRKSIRASADLC